MNGYRPAGDEVVQFIRNLYAMEKEACEKGISTDKWADLRNEKSKPLLDDFNKWLDEKSVITVPKSALGKAITYSLD